MIELVKHGYIQTEIDKGKLVLLLNLNNSSMWYSKYQFNSHCFNIDTVKDIFLL